MRPDSWNAWARIRVTVLAVLVLALGATEATLAQNVTRFGDEAEQLPGIVQAGYRLYSHQEGNVLAYVFRFDTDANASAALETLDSEYETGLAGTPVPFDLAAADTRAYSHDDTWTEVLVQEGPYLYIVSIVFWESQLNHVMLATALLEMMIAADAGDGLGDYQPDGSSTGGIWDKLPSEDDELPAGLWVTKDDQVYPARGDTESGELDFGAMDGVRLVISRDYLGDMSLLETPETTPPGTYLITAVVAEFESAEQAAAAIEPFREAANASWVDMEVTFEPVDPGDIGDEAVADAGTMDDGDRAYELVTIIVRADARLYLVGGLGIGTNTNVMETSTGVIEAMVDAEPGDGEPAFDETGRSTGGLWDIFPAEGDPVLGDLVPDEDGQAYP